MKRRETLALGGAAAAAATAGIGWGWHTFGHDPLDEGFWRLRFEQPNGGELALQTFRHQALLLNFWAPWCPPCVTELPLLSNFYEQHRHAGWQVVGLAIDQKPAVQSFLAAHPVRFAIGLAGAAGLDLARRLGNVSGGLPFTFVYPGAGATPVTQLGALDAELLQRWSALAVAHRPGV